MGRIDRSIRALAPLRLVALVAHVSLVALVLGHARPAAAAPRYVDRPLTLPRLVFQGDPGLGLAHLRFGRQDFTGAGANLEGAIGVTDSVELGLRTGLRLGDDARLLGADAYGRTFFTETYGTNVDTLANPEFRVRWAAYSGRVAEVGIDGRVYLPFETGSSVGVMFGVPFAFHVADILRIDLGLYLPIVTSDPTVVVISVPAYFWFQVSNSVWLGPMLGLRHVDPGGPAPSHDDLLVGFGIGYQVSESVDLKWQVFAPRVNGNDADPRVYGGGMGVAFRIGE